MFREHQRTGTALSDQQLAALDHMKGKTDFNDRANKSVLGKEGSTAGCGQPSMT